VRVLPGGVLIIEEIAAKLGRPLFVGKGGVREGAILELVTPDLEATI
jgi:exopolyphosphatase/pppGpp-phosphohydrolase